MARKRGLYRFQTRPLVGAGIQDDEVSLEVTFRLSGKKALEPGDSVKLGQNRLALLRGVQKVVDWLARE